jgi:hypothetical protein
MPRNRQRRQLEGREMSGRHKRRKPELARSEAEPESSARETDFKSEVDYAIWRRVCGEPTPWLINSEFKAEGTFQERFNEGKGDTQILLWAIWDYARRDKPSPKWVTEALYDILFDMAKGGLKKNSWNDAFGKPYADRKQPGGMRTRAQMFDVYREVNKLDAERMRGNKKINRYDIYAEAGKRLNPSLNPDAVKQLFGLVKKAVDRGEWEPCSAIFARE